ncbi:MAG: tRNA guanosine(15) transglycosylase TgtA [Promethearchaeota archaeon]
MKKTTFELLDRDAGGRIGRLQVRGKKLDTPNIFVVVSPRENIIPPAELTRTFGAQAVFTNSYIAYKNPELREQVLSRKVHDWLGFDGIVATDSGAFQHYMYEHDLDVTPSEIEGFQESIGSDCPVILDVPVQLADSEDVARSKVETTVQRARDNISRRTMDDTCWFGPIHGTMYLDLLRESARQMGELDFGIYAIGGVVKTFINYDFALDVDILCTVKEVLTEGRPLHMFGLGLPQFFALAVACGCDTMDSAAYALYAKEGRYFTLEGTKKLENLSEFPCCCPACSQTSPREVEGMDKAERTRFLATHNLHVTFSELRNVRQAIREGTLWELAERRSRSHPKLIDAMRRVQKHAKYLESKEPSTKRRGIMYTGQFTKDRPAVRRAVRRVLDHYSPPESKAFAVLLPEVDTTAVGSPAVNSWRKNIEKSTGSGVERVHFIYINPLFGPVPSELATVYPFSQNVFCVDSDEAGLAHVSGKIRDYFRAFDNYEGVFVYRPRVFESENGGILPVGTLATDLFVEGTRREGGISPPVRDYTDLDLLAADLVGALGERVRSK